VIVKMELLLLDNEEQETSRLLALSMLLLREPSHHTNYQVTINHFDDDEFVEMFRFTKEQFSSLFYALKFPDKVKLPNNSIVKGEECFMILLRRLVYPCRLVDLVRIFGKPKSVLSMAINWTLEHIYEKYGYLLEFDSNRIITRLEDYAYVVQEKGAPLSRCVGFIDGTARPLARPTVHQRMFFSGHKRVHCIKFQSIMMPDGIIAHLSGPWNGTRHDAGIFYESDIENTIGRHLNVNGIQYYIYGDPAYPLNGFLITPFKDAFLDDAKREFNKRMSRVRESVEWGFQKIISLFAFLDFKKNLKLHLQPVGKYYLVGAFLTNCHTCFNSSQVTSYFGMSPVSLHEYLHLSEDDN
jgi:DDE superfamily endonuclease